ncbi:pentatricopeptide repeat-containing protein [Reticulomyxa filosa]|uniref:Pentatricopeptide repeat-containing protein n=1 Tax=Reticulomyxa filosa TaxID=46433 RepID=X6M300_RETFI|nr:pentatricopeptide repeat-containing protein [Reticulomyxa filosa]|eukprot:ETO08324.1 pentatricopeptide repeat-containing protein [Reticulomyxa filosa]
MMKNNNQEHLFIQKPILQTNIPSSSSTLYDKRVNMKFFWKDNQAKKKLQRQSGTLVKAIPPPQSRNVRLLIKQMIAINDIIQFLENTPFQDSSVYSVAIKRCSELKQPNSFHQIIQLIHQQNISLNAILCSSILHYLGIWNKLELQKELFEQWFIHKQFTSNITSFGPTMITFNTMIKYCSKRGDIKRELHYFQLLVDHYNLKPDSIACNSMLSAYVNSCDMESAEIIWKKIQNEPDIQINIIILTSMLNVYAKCRKSKKTMDLLNYSQQPEYFISINEITCSVVMSGLLKDNKIDEMFDFYQNEIPKLSFKIISILIMEILDDNESDKLSYHQQYLNILFTGLYPNVNKNSISIDATDMERLICSYVLSHKKDWMNAVQNMERILYQKLNYIHSFNYWKIDIFNKRQVLLDFSIMSKISFFLRYLMTFKRNGLKHEFKEGPIKILCGKDQYLKIMKKCGIYESPKKKGIENELKKWKTSIRLEQDQLNEAVWCLNQDDVSLL